jgi:hypothetical protein
VISVYDVQQSIEEPMSLCFETRIRDDGVVAGYEGKRDVTSIGSLWVVSTLHVYCEHLDVPWGL